MNKFKLPFHKGIIGAALKDFRAIESYAFNFTYAGFDIIDISAFPLSVIYALKGIQKAQLALKGKLKRLPELMISINFSSDSHFRRIVVDDDFCTKCQLCIASCPSEAYTDEDMFTYYEDLCFGCANCLEYCPYEALSFKEFEPCDNQSLHEMSKLGASALEIHLGDELSELKTFLNDTNLSAFKTLSFSVSLSRLEVPEIQKIIKGIVNLTANLTDKVLIIQTDGRSQSGARASKTKDELSIKNACQVIDILNKLKVSDKYLVQLAGGTNDQSLAKAYQEQVKVDGIGLGSYARALMLESNSPAERAQKIIDSSVKNYLKVIS